MDYNNTSFFEEKMYLAIPKDFTDMKKEETMRYFPYILRPQNIKANKERKVILTHSLLQRELNEKDIFPAAGEMLRQINNLHPGSALSSVFLSGNEKHIAGWFVYRTGSFQGEIWHIQYILPVGGKFLLGGLHYPADQKDKWMEVFRHMLRSVKAVKSKNVYGKEVLYWET